MNRTAPANGPAVTPAVETQARPSQTPRTKYPEIFGMLAREFRPEHIKVRTQAGRRMQYITARTVMNRLDFALGPENWWDEYRAGEHSVECRLTIRLPDGRILTKSDAGGYAGMQDPGDDDKSGYADAFKRAAVKFGVGRHLYNDGVVSYPKDRPLPADAPARRVEPPATTPDASVEPEPPESFWTWLQRRVDEVNNDWAAMCAKERKPHKKLIEHPNEALNGVISVWLEKELIRPEDVKGSKKDTRSTARMRNIVDLQNEDDAHATRADFSAYFDDKWSRELEKLGINLDAEPTEEPAS